LTLAFLLNQSTLVAYYVGQYFSCYQQQQQELSIADVRLIN